jgi:chromosome segregation protein
VFNLYLKKIEIQGFKSFAERTSINFDQKITAIVGPNGSGKSNIADALRWVLGEQSIRNLRGNKMEDIIFSGTEKKKPLGFAEVTIIFDNTDNFIPLEYNEISISRRMYRSGESEFFINKSPCRLKDIKELFADTGIGKEGYSIIGQGKIEDIISSHPENRRLIFEEAAGIVKYKLNRQEAIRKLEKTNANIMRISDLLNEVDNQRSTLQIEAEKAMTYKLLFDKIKIIDLAIAKNNYNKLIKYNDEKKQELKKYIDYKNTIQDKIKLLTYDQQEWQNKIIDIETLIEDKRNIKLEIIQSYERTKNAEAMTLEKIFHNNNEIERLNNEIKITKEKISLNKKENQIFSNQVEDLKKDCENALKELQALEESKIILKKRLEENTKSLKFSDENMIKLHTLYSEIKSEISSVETFISNIVQRIAKIELSISEYNKTNNNLGIEISNMNERIDLLESELNKLIKIIEKIEHEKEQIDSELSNIEVEINKLEQDRIKTLTTLKLYLDLESNLEGYYTSTKEILKLINRDEEYNNTFIGIVKDLFKVEKKYAKAIEVALGSSIQNIVVRDEESAKKFITFLKAEKKGRATFLPINSVNRSFLNINNYDKKFFGIVGLANEVIEYESNLDNVFSYLLGKTVLIDNLDNAFKFSKETNRKYRLVTLDGDIVSPGGSITGGHKSNESHGILIRKVLIEELDSKLSKIDDDLNKLKTKKKTILNNEQAKAMKIKEIKNQFDTYMTELNSLKNMIEQRKSQEVFNSKEVNIKNAEKNDLLNELERLNKKLIELKNKSGELSVAIDNEKNNNNHYRSLDSDINKDLTEIDMQISDCKFRIKIDSKSIEDMNLKKIKLEEEIDSLNAKISQDENLITDLKFKNAEYENKLSETKESIKELEELKEKENKILEEILKKRESTKKEHYKLQDLINIENKKLSKIEKEVNKIEVEIVKIEMNLDNLIQRISDEYKENIEDMDNDCLIIDDYNPKSDDLQLLKNELNKLEGVNLASIDEYEKVKQRHEFLSGQLDDLVRAKSDVERVIAEINAKIKKQFLRVIKQIDENFNKIYKELFGGGSANIIINDEEDVENNDIQIMIQPPGKKMQNLSLLSGGEKSLTAIALLFAILKTKPSPFCVLDEIDAALDEANILRFTSYLSKFKDNTQFILITHRKTSMEIAESLYGISMQDEGISKVLSIKLDDFNEESGEIIKEA